MALWQTGGELTESASDLLNGSRIEWLSVAAVVYAWTDRREATEDMAWWQAAGACSHAPFAEPETLVRMPAEVASNPLDQIGTHSSAESSDPEFDLAVV